MRSINYALTDLSFNADKKRPRHWTWSWDSHIHLRSSQIISLFYPLCSTWLLS